MILEEQMKQQMVTRPVAALNAFYVYAPGPMRPHLVSGKVKTAASQFREVTMMFIRIGGLHYSDLDFVAKFQRVVYMILSAVYVYKGSVSGPHSRLRYVLVKLAPKLWRSQLLEP